MWNVSCLPLLRFSGVGGGGREVGLSMFTTDLMYSIDLFSLKG
jgi:hypothetical protein